MGVGSGSALVGGRTGLEFFNVLTSTHVVGTQQTLTGLGDNVSGQGQMFTQRAIGWVDDEHVRSTAGQRLLVGAGRALANGKAAARWLLLVGESAVVVLPSIHRVVLLGVGSRLRAAEPGGSSCGAEPMTELHREEVGERGAVLSRTKVGEDHVGGDAVLYLLSLSKWIAERQGN